VLQVGARCCRSDVKGGDLDEVVFNCDLCLSVNPCVEAESSGCSRLVECFERPETGGPFTLWGAERSRFAELVANLPE
jgi:predicted ribonuclease YlaK